MKEKEIDYLETDIIKQYIQEIKKHPILSIDEQKTLARKYQQGDLSAKQQLINSNLRYVASLAFKYKEKLKSLNLLDIIQEGNLGLMHAIDLYDPEEGALTTYIHKWIQSYIDRSIMNLNNNIRTPVPFQEVKNKYFKLINEYKNKNIPMPTNEEICVILNITNETLKLIQSSDKLYTDSLNRTIGDEEKSELQDFIEYHDNQIDKVLDDMDTQILLFKLKRSLSPIEYYILYNTILFEKKETLKTIGKKFDVTDERIRQLQLKAIKKSKKVVESSKKSNQTIKKIEKENLSPIEPNDVINYIYLKEGLSDIETHLLYLILINKNNYSKKEYAKLLNCSKEEYESISKNLKKYIVNKMQDKEKYKRTKNNLLKTYGVKLYKLLEEKTEIIDFCSLKENYENKTYEEILEYFQETLNTLTYNEQELLKKYFLTTKKTKARKELIERKINLALKNKLQKENTNLPKKVLYKTLKENKHLFSQEQILYLECYYFNTKEKALFKTKYPNTTLRSSSLLIERLESLYFNINKILENNFNKEKYLTIRDKLNDNQKLYLDLFYGIYIKPLSIIKISEKFNEDYRKTHDKIRDARNHAINLYCNRNGKLQIDKDIYLPYIQNKEYDFKEETRNILKMYLIDNLSYTEIAEKTTLSNYKISNIITEAIRKMDFYRYHITEVFTITIDEFNGFINYHKSYNETEKKILKKRFIEYKNIDEIANEHHYPKKNINTLIGNFIKLYNKYTVRNIELSNIYIHNILNSHFTESILTEEEKEIIALYLGIKSKYNPKGDKLTAQEIANKKNTTRNIIYHTTIRCIDRMKLHKIEKFNKDLCYIKRDELDNLLDDKFLPITQKERKLICHLFALKNHEYKTLKEIGDLYSITESSARRRYQRAILNILKYQNNEIEGNITYESIDPYLKYFSNSDRKLLEEYYKNNLTYENISQKYNLSRDKVITIFNRLKPFLFELLKEEKVKKFDFDYYELVKNDSLLPFYGNKEETIKIFDLFFGQTSIERKSAPIIIEELNLNITPSTINRLIQSLMISIEKYKIGIKKIKTYSYQDILEYYNNNKKKMSLNQIKIYEKYFSKMSKKKIYNSKYQYPSEEILFDLIKATEDYIKIDEIQKEEILALLKNTKIKFSKYIKEIIMSYFGIDYKEIMSGKDKNHVYRILDKLEKNKILNNQILLKKEQ